MIPRLREIATEILESRPDVSLGYGLLGPPGSGKTAALERILRTLAEHGQRGYRVDLRGKSESQTWEVYAQIQQTLGFPRLGAAENRLFLVRSLVQLAEKGKLVLALDHFEDLPEEAAHDLISDLREIQQTDQPVLGNLTCLVAGAISIHELRRRANSPNLQFRHACFPLSRPEDRQASTQAWLAERRYELDAAALQVAIEESGGEPAYLDLLLGNCTGVSAAELRMAAESALGAESGYLSGPALAYWMDSAFRKKASVMLERGRVATDYGGDIHPLQRRGAVIATTQPPYTMELRNGMIRRLVSRLQAQRLGGNGVVLEPGLTKAWQLRQRCEEARDLRELHAALTEAIREVTGFDHTLRVSVTPEGGATYSFPVGPQPTPEPRPPAILRDNTLLYTQGGYWLRHTGSACQLHFHLLPTQAPARTVRFTERETYTGYLLEAHASRAMTYVWAEIGRGRLWQNSSEVNVSPTVNKKKIFVIHGRDLATRDAMFDMLRAMRLEPLEWSEAQALTGQAAPVLFDVIDKGMEAAQACLVLLTGDDEARLREVHHGGSDPSHETDLTPQARPNVLFEAGMALGRYRDRTVLVEFGRLRPFTDVSGFNTIRFSDTPQKRQEIAQALTRAGCTPDTTSGMQWMQAGRFPGKAAGASNS